MTAPGTRPRRARGQAALLGAVRFYQRAISPAFPPRCRFVPTCSSYALEAIERHGAVHGGWLALRRLVKCAPWHPGGVDLVPEPAPSRRPGTRTPARSSNSAAPIPVPESPAERNGTPPPTGSSHPAGLRPGPAAGGLRCSE